MQTWLKVQGRIFKSRYLENAVHRVGSEDAIEQVGIDLKGDYDMYDFSYFSRKSRSLRNDFCAYCFTARCHKSSSELKKGLIYVVK